MATLILSVQIPYYWGQNYYMPLTSGLKIGAPQKHQIQPRQIQPPICGLLKLFSVPSDTKLVLTKDYSEISIFQKL